MAAELTEGVWRKKLSSEQYHVLREGGTESPFTGKLLANKAKVDYVCGACGATVFKSDTIFESGSGWPSFYDVATKGAVTSKEDGSLGMRRTEVLCANCGSHLGHVFNDANDQPTGRRHCINSMALGFNQQSEKKKG